MRTERGEVDGQRAELGHRLLASAPWKPIRDLAVQLREGRAGRRCRVDGRRAGNSLIGDRFAQRLTLDPGEGESAVCVRLTQERIQPERLGRGERAGGRASVLIIALAIDLQDHRRAPRGHQLPDVALLWLVAQVPERR